MRLLSLPGKVSSVPLLAEVIQIKSIVGDNRPKKWIFLMCLTFTVAPELVGIVVAGCGAPWSIVVSHRASVIFLILVDVRHNAVLSSSSTSSCFY